MYVPAARDAKTGSRYRLPPLVKMFLDLVIGSWVSPLPLETFGPAIFPGCAFPAPCALAPGAGPAPT